VPRERAHTKKKILDWIGGDLWSTGPGDLLWVNSGINWGRRIRRTTVDL